MPSKPSSYINRLFMRVISIILVVGIVVPLMKFMQVDETDYKPYMYFAVALLVLSTFLHNKGGEMLTES